MPLVRQVDPEKVIRSLIDGGPGKEWKFQRVEENGERVEFTYRMQVLLAQENIDGIQSAQGYAKDRELGGYGDIYREATVHEILVRAMRHPAKREMPNGTSHYPPIFTDVSQLRASFTEPEIVVLFNAYEITKAEFGIVRGLEDESAETWIARFSDPLKGFFYLSQLDSQAWPGAIMMIAKVARGLFQELGHELPSLEPTSESARSSSQDSTGSSGRQLSGSSTDGKFEVKPGELLTREQARDLVSKKNEGE